jgi:hypothetical protein
MSLNLMLRFALGMANVPDKDVDDLEKQLPALARLIAAFKDMNPDLEALAPHIEAMGPEIEALMPIAERLAPKIKTAWPDLITLVPVVQEYVDLAQKP